ncbi:hypothetical protein MKW94_029638 [Papaver nudicaule]|uniref:ABC transporter domain-containing protein n=1 Tax=Papaver nudicaule TaxID=74823 RepID=A0AA42AWW6_PAPNU|nr:hypothetical protein [Papaver nudicaule]
MVWYTYRIHVFYVSFVSSWYGIYQICVICRSNNISQACGSSSTHLIIETTTRKMRFRSNLMFSEHIPIQMHDYIDGVEDVKKDGHYKVLKPNLGRFNLRLVAPFLEPPKKKDWQEILTYFRGSENAIIKPHYVDHIPKAVQGNVGQVLNQVIERNMGDLSGGELHRFAIAVVAIQNAEIYMIDEPSKGINIFLAGFVPSENLRFRDESLTFKVAETPQETAEEIQSYAGYKYPTMRGTDSQIVVMLGENGIGKTTFICMLAGLFKPDEVESSDVEIPEFNFLTSPRRSIVSDVMKPLQIEHLMDQVVVNLSGGELQRVALCLCLGKPADIYLIDEPSAYLDSEQRIVASKVIKRFILHAKKTAFVVEHDFIMATYLADKVIVYEGQPSIDCTANAPQSLLTGMNLFLSVTFSPSSTSERQTAHSSPSLNSLALNVTTGNAFMTEAASPCRIV